MVLINVCTGFMDIWKKSDNEGKSFIYQDFIITEHKRWGWIREQIGC